MNLRTLTAVGLATALLSSCQLAMHEAHASAAKWEKDTTFTMGGTTHTTGADGWNNTTDHNASFQVAMQTGGAALAGWVLMLQQKASLLTQQLANAQAGTTARAKIAADLAATKFQLDAATAQQAAQLAAKM